MKKVTLTLMAALLTAGTALAQLGQPAAAIAGKTLEAQGNTNYSVTMDCTKGKEVFIEMSYDCKTNYVNNTTFPTATTNVTAVFRKGIGSSAALWGEGTGIAIPVAHTLTVPGMTAGTTSYASTNITMNGCPYLQLWYVTNACAVDVNCQVTNLTIRYWVK